MPLIVKVEQEFDGRWMAEVPALPGVLAYGPTYDQALNRAEALALRVLADRMEAGEDIPQAGVLFYGLTTCELMEQICKRPLCWCAGIETTRELLCFLDGVCRSAEHLHGHDLGGFSEYLQRRFDKSPIHGWTKILGEELGAKPYEEGRDAILALLREWFASRANKGE